MTTVTSTDGLVDESALPDGSGGGSVTDSGSFAITLTGLGGPAKVEVQISTRVWVAAYAGMTAKRKNRSEGPQNPSVEVNSPTRSSFAV